MLDRPELRVNDDTVTDIDACDVTRSHFNCGHRATNVSPAYKPTSRAIERQYGSGTTALEGLGSISDHIHSLSFANDTSDPSGSIPDVPARNSTRRSRTAIDDRNSRRASTPDNDAH